jgi:hypothetical protein
LVHDELAAFELHQRAGYGDVSKEHHAAIRLTLCLDVEILVAIGFMVDLDLALFALILKTWSAPSMWTLVRNTQSNSSPSSAFRLTVTGLIFSTLAFGIITSALGIPAIRD